MWGWPWYLVALAIGVGLYLVAVVALVLAGRTQSARALAGFIPDCVVLFTRLQRDPNESRGRRLALLRVVAYLVMPCDLVPDFTPVAGQLDDAVVTLRVLRYVIRGTPNE